MFKLFNSLKDKFVSGTARLLLKSKFERYGEMLDLNIDTTNKNVSIILDLKGEERPVELRFLGYSLNERDEKLFLQISQVKSSKEWIENLAADFVANKEIEIPPNLRSTLKLVL